MKRLECILLAVDRNDHAPAAVTKAAAIARQFGARLRLFACDAECGYVLKREYSQRGVDTARADSLAQLRLFLESLGQSVQPKDLEIGIGLACESPLYESILREVDTVKPDLLIRCIEGDGAGGVRVTGTELALLRNCPVPLLLARTRSWPRRPRIAAAVDISDEELPELTRHILQTAALLSKDAEGELEVVHAMHSDETTAHTTREGRRTLAGRVTESGVDAQRLQIVIGEPATEIARLARERQYDVVVLGTLTHRKVPAAYVGTLTARLLDTLECDFLLVKPPAWRPPATAHVDQRACIAG